MLGYGLRRWISQLPFSVLENESELSDHSCHARILFHAASNKTAPMWRACSNVETVLQCELPVTEQLGWQVAEAVPVPSTDLAPTPTATKILIQIMRPVAFDITPTTRTCRR